MQVIARESPRTYKHKVFESHIVLASWHIKNGDHICDHRFLVGVSGFEPEASWTRIKTHLFNIILLYLKSVDFMRILWYHCVVKFYSVVYLFVSLFTQVFTFWRQ